MRSKPTHDLRLPGLRPPSTVGGEVGAVAPSHYMAEVREVRRGDLWGGGVHRRGASKMAEALSHLTLLHSFRRPDRSQSWVWTWRGPAAPSFYTTLSESCQLSEPVSPPVPGRVALHTSSVQGRRDGGGPGTGRCLRRSRSRPWLAAPVRPTRLQAGHRVQRPCRHSWRVERSAHGLAAPTPREALPMEPLTPRRPHSLGCRLCSDLPSAPWHHAQTVGVPALRALLARCSGCSHPM